MIRALYSSATGMKAQEYMIDVTANNLANVNTNGFKRSQIDFADLVYSTIREPGANVTSEQQSPTGFQIGSGARPVGTTKLFTEGTIEPTGNPLDVAIQGDGFLEVQVSGEPRYTRDGALRLSATGQIVTGDGFVIEGAQIPTGASSITIGPDGTVSAVVNGVPENAGQIPLVRFPNPAGLSSLGGNLYGATDASGPREQGIANQNGMGSLLGGHLERSNVEVVTELISLITAQRAYEINSRAIRAGDEMLSVSADIVR